MIAGMLADTLIASFLIPVSFYVVERVSMAINSKAIKSQRNLRFLGIGRLRLVRGWRFAHLTRSRFYFNVWGLNFRLCGGLQSERKFLRVC